MSYRNQQTISLLILLSFVFSSAFGKVAIAIASEESPVDNPNTENVSNDDTDQTIESDTEEEGAINTPSTGDTLEIENEDAEPTTEPNSIEEDQSETDTEEDDPIEHTEQTEYSTGDIQTSDEPEVNTETTEETTAEKTATDGNAYIETGVSYAALNIVNILNSNLINSNGLIIFLTNLFNSQKQLLDLRDYGFLSDSEYDENCESNVCGSDHLTIGNTNDGHIINDVYVGATSGNNHVSSGGNGAISTGDAYASANVINIANTSIVDSDYLILTFSSFGDWNGDVVFPNAEALASLFGGGSTYNNVDIENRSNATVINDTDVSADSGNNSAIAGNGSTISTGNASASTGVLNQLNSNIFGSGNFSVIFRVHGDWLGDIFSLPKGISYEKNSAGLTLLNLSGSFDSPIDSLVTDSVVIKNENNAHIENNLIVTAVSGKNSIEAEGGAVINTGNAYASANVTNIANTNIVGKNWILAIIDIFGNWNGNISFGRPDLWIGEQISTDGKVTNGSTVDYTYTLMNNGDTKATNITVTDSIDGRYIKFLNSSRTATVNDDSIEWKLDSLAPGEVVEIIYSARIENVPYGETEITNNVTVRANEPDENDTDNTDSAGVVAYRRAPSRQFKPSDLIKETQSSLPLISIESTNNASLVVTDETPVTYQIKLTNNGTSTVKNTVLTDHLKAPNGETLNIETFELDTIDPGEVVIVEYTVVYNDSFTSGIYTNHSQASYIDNLDKPSVSASATSRVNYLKTAPTTPTEPTDKPEIEGESKSIKRDAPSLRLIPIAEASNYTDSIDNDSMLLASVARFRTNATFASAFAILLLLLAFEISRQRRYR